MAPTRRSNTHREQPPPAGKTGMAAGAMGDGTRAQTIGPLVDGQTDQSGSGQYGSVVMEPVFQQQPHPFTSSGGCDDLTDDEDIEARGLHALEQLHVELHEKKRCLDALERQGKLRAIRQKANEAREQLQRLDEYLTTVEAGVDA